VTIAEKLDPTFNAAVINARGLPGYMFERAAGELWRCRFDAKHNMIVVNSGHRDFVFATRNRALQLRYLVRLYVKELVLKNFAGLPAEQLLERMVKLSLYAEEKLKSGERPDGHFKFPHLWPVKLPQAGRADYASGLGFDAIRAAASLSR